jgi:hypothetical protein
MQKTRSYIVFLFILASLLIFIRPVLFFVSPLIQESLADQVKTYGLAKIVRKRNEYNYTQDDAVAEVEVCGMRLRKLFPAPLLLRLLRTHFREVINQLSIQFSQLSSLAHYLRCLAELSPQSDRYAAVAVFRI